MTSFQVLEAQLRVSVDIFVLCNCKIKKMTKGMFLKSLRFSLLANYMSRRLSCKEGNYD